MIEKNNLEVQVVLDVSFKIWEMHAYRSIFTSYNHLNNYKLIGKSIAKQKMLESIYEYNWLSINIDIRSMPL